MLDTENDDINCATLRGGDDSGYTSETKSFIMKRATPSSLKRLAVVFFIAMYLSVKM